MEENFMEISKIIYDNLEGEQVALSGYSALLAELTGKGLFPEDVSTIREIISDELNHSIKLLAMSRKYHGIAATPDGYIEALEALAEGVEAMGS